VLSRLDRGFTFPRHHTGHALIHHDSPVRAMTSGMFLIHSMLLHSRDTREIGIEPGGHAAAPSPHDVGPSYRSINSEVAPCVSKFLFI
jgi:hypothetical protein